MSDADGIDEALEGVMRVAVTSAGRFGEKMARFWEERAREAQARSQQEQREFQGRFDAQRSAARADLRPVQDSTWWDRADASAVAHAHETATTWSRYDPEAEAAATRIRDEVQQRYGFDVNQTGELSREVLGATETAARARQQEAEERARSATDASEAQHFLAEANALDEFARENRERADELERRVNWDAGDDESVGLFDQAQESRTTADDQGGRSHDSLVQAADLYDSAERRGKFADELGQTGATAEQVRDRILSDTDQARHPREAVATPKTTTKARPKRAAASPERGRVRSR